MSDTAKETYKLTRQSMCCPEPQKANIKQMFIDMQKELDDLNFNYFMKKQLH